jgi:hypothetical protein
VAPLDRRRFLGLLPAVGIAGCSPEARGQGTYTVVNDFSEIALSPDGGVCVAHPMDEPGTFLIFGRDLSEPRAIAFPQPSHWVRDLTFAPDGLSLFFTAGPPPFDTHSSLYRLDLATLTAQRVETGHDYNRAPAPSPDSTRLAFAARSAGGPSLSIREQISGQVASRPITPQPFQSISALKHLPGGGFAVGGVPGSDPFDSLRLDQENGFQRLFVANGAGDLRSLTIADRAASTHQLKDVDGGGRLLLTVRYDRPDDGADIRLVVVEADLSTHRLVDIRPLRDHVITGAAIGRESGDIVARGQIIGPDQTSSEVIAFQDGDVAALVDLSKRAARSTITV